MREQARQQTPPPSPLPSPQIRVPLFPATVTNCGNGICYDNQGNSYRQSDDGMLYRSDGKVCRTIVPGSQLQCN